MCVYAMQVAHAQSVHKVLGEAGGEDTGLLAVVEVMLDLTESSVAFCWELGAGQPFWHHTWQKILCSAASKLHQLKCLERVSSSACFHTTVLLMTSAFWVGLRAISLLTLLFSLQGWLCLLAHMGQRCGEVAS